MTDTAQAEKKYKDDMSEEKAPSKLLPEGWRALKVVSMEETESKAGNLMFVTQVQDMETKDEQTIYLVAVKGKRWMLKSLLESIGVDKDNDGNFVWDVEDVIGRLASGKVVHEEESWIDRQGNDRTSLKSRIVEFTEETGKAWDE